ncbi:MAG: 50S ribosomal protein L29 [Tannerella sp.]|jgi:large subunit ribosomal protein L29|nr:50S ribosomal protein L29 [Tannerella sp.]
MKTTEVRELSTKEIEERIDAEKSALEQKKINHSISPLDNPSQIKEQRRTIARLKTELHHRIKNNK